MCLARISAPKDDGMTVLMLHRITPSTVLSPCLNGKKSRIPGTRSGGEVMPWKKFLIFSWRLCRLSSRRVCSRTSAHLTARMTERSVAAATASSSSHVMVATGEASMAPSLTSLSIDALRRLRAKSSIY